MIDVVLNIVRYSVKRKSFLLFSFFNSVMSMRGLRILLS